MLTKLLVVYSSVLTTVLAAFALTGSVAAKPQTFDEIDVRRINVREPDGTLRLVISNRARLPGVIVQGKEQPPVDRPQAGLLFTTTKVRRMEASSSADTATPKAKSRIPVEASHLIATRVTRSSNSPAYTIRRITS